MCAAKTVTIYPQHARLTRSRVPPTTSPPVRHCRSVTCQHRRNKTNNRALDMVAQPSKSAGSTGRRRVQKRRRQRTAAAIPGPDGAAQVDDGDESSSKRKEVIDDVNGMNDLSGMSEDISGDHG